jgi:predicted metal-dependent hydrolase
MDTIHFPFKNQTITIKCKPTARAKRLSLRFVPREKGFVLTTPLRTTERQIKDFLTHCTPWIEKQSLKMFHVKHFKIGDEIHLHGIPFQCVLDPLRKKPVLCQVTQTLRLPPKYTPQVLYNFLKKMAEDHLEPYVWKVVQELGQTLEKVTFRDTKSRWGSCSARKTISLSWRLILAPPEVAKYVCVHEAAHLIHMNHSKAFWKTVEGLCPGYKSHRKWLKINGLSLMRL